MPSSFDTAGGEGDAAIAGGVRIHALDGLRGLAMAMVIVDHGAFFLWPSAAGLLAPGGFLGLDLFFVLSGYLITTLILERRRKGERGLGKFYARRALRILPALAVMLIVVGVWSIVAGTDDASSVVYSAVVAITNFASWILHFLPPWFAGEHWVAPMGIVWSLAVEERFYVVWPAVLLVLLRLERSRRFILGCIAIGIVGFAIQNHLLWRRHHDWTQSYFRTDARAGELLVGAALAVGAPLLVRIPPRLLSTAASVVLAGFLVGVEVLHPATRALYYGGFTALALAAAVLVIACADGRPMICRPLSWPPLVGLGTVSYSLYLWHYPVFSIVAERAPDNPPLRIALGLVITTVLVALSYRFIEQPALALRRRMIPTGTHGADLDPHLRASSTHRANVVTRDA